MSNVIETLIASETPAELRKWLQIKLSELPSESDYTCWGWVQILADHKDDPTTAAELYTRAIAKEIVSQTTDKELSKL